MIIVGLTGGIATGKSTISTALNKEWPVIDADSVAKSVLEPNGSAYDSVIKTFGPLIEDLADETTGQIAREKLGALVFRDKSLLKKLNSITHPAIIKTILKTIVWNWWNGTKILVLDIPLLFETKLHLICSTVVVVSCDEEFQLKRLLARNPQLTEQEAKDRINAQMKLADKVKMASIVVDNNGTKEQLDSKIESLIATVKLTRWPLLSTLKYIFFFNIDEQIHI